MTNSSASGDSRLALSAGIGCYLIWGFVPLVFQTIGHMGVGPWEILCHRVLWSLPTAGLLVALAGQGRHLVEALRAPRVFAWLALSSLLIATNWVIYIGAVNTGHVLEASLGYYITPLVNMAAGALLFRERIDRLGYASMALAAVGVAIQAVAMGGLPVISLVLAFSFGGYGIVRKRVAADAQTGFFVECLVVGLPALAYVVWLQRSGAGHFGHGAAVSAWLVAAGPITAIPLVLFAWAARRIPLSAMGFLQFLSPTIGFFIGLAEGEAFTPLRALSFVFIWGGAAVFLWGAWRRARSVRIAVAEATPAE
ncbi:EamA family transporter RarD [Phenylobacterium soli]|uniref:EamA family transporter RarD n=1 Tax=Phenylobacterium soli TaxID=2170551 RepID=A0A328AG05_9CAUL|nr:EamA family transporter RarD [Phenylobacterium soli]RAK53660.1 EamA family transporter RarD [Phenylobacterium soli]